MLRFVYSSVVVLLIIGSAKTRVYSFLGKSEALSSSSKIETATKTRFKWDSRKKLTWSDFKGVPDRTSKFSASANTGMSHNYTIDSKGFLEKDKSRVQANFYPYLSWYIPKLINETTLGHEQTHFDISELHARKLRKAIADFRFSAHSKQEIQKIYATIERERKAMQKQFDHDTQHSLARKKEQAWEQFIQKELARYAKWGS